MAEGQQQVSEPQPGSEEAEVTSKHQEASMENAREPQQVEEEATQQPVSSEKADEPESEVATSTQHQPVSSEIDSETQKPAREEAQQPASLEKDSEPHQAESDKETTTPTEQPASVEKASGPQKPESEEVTSEATPTQQPESSEKVNSESGQAESATGVESQSKSEEGGGGGGAAASEQISTDASVAPEVDNCPFCQIVAKLSSAKEVYRDDDFVCFEDKNPASTLHYLLVPRKHHQDLRSLTTEHLPLLARMVEVAKTVLKEGRGDPDDVRMGFHLPPFLRVSHLHMHIISPASRMSWLNRNIVFRKDSFAFVSPTGAISYLKK